jgi:hypothetical protein
MDLKKLYNRNSNKKVKTKKDQKRGLTSFFGVLGTHPKELCYYVNALSG